MRIVTIHALDQAFIYPMMEWFGEIRLGFKVTPEAELRLGHLQQGLPYFGRVSGMAVHASDVVLHVGGTEKVTVLFTKFMAGQTALARFQFADGIERDDLVSV